MPLSIDVNVKNEKARPLRNIKCFIKFYKMA